MCKEIDCRRTDRGQPYFATPSNPPTNDTIKPEDDSNMPSTNVHVETVGKILMTYNMWEKELGQPATSSSRHIFHTAPSVPCIIDSQPTWINSNINVFFPILGYVQGMSDLCAPLYVVFGADEVTTYFAFVKLMEKMVRLQSPLTFEYAHLIVKNWPLSSLLQKSHFLRDQSVRPMVFTPFLLTLSSKPDTTLFTPFYTSGKYLGDERRTFSTSTTAALNRPAVVLSFWKNQQPEFVLLFPVDFDKF